MTEALYLIETSMFINDVARYMKTIPGPISPYVIPEALFYTALLAAAGYLVSLIHGAAGLVLLLPAIFIAMAAQKEEGSRLLSFSMRFTRRHAFVGR